MEIIMGLAYFFTIFSGYGLFFRKLMKIEFSHVLVFAFSIILSVYLIGALLNILDTSIYCSFVVGGGLFIYIVLDFFQHQEMKDFGKLLTWDVIVFIVAILAYYDNVSHLITYAFWDEYSLWGVLIKEFNHFHG